MAKHELGMLLNRKIKKISADADRLLDAGDYGAAVERYNDAFELLPTPKEQWNASLWLLGSIGNAAFFGQDYDFARGVLQDAISLPDGLGNAFIHLRLGTCHFELEDLDAAADELMRAYMAAGEDVFEDEDPKYREFLGTRAKLP